LYHLALDGSHRRSLLKGLRQEDDAMSGRLAGPLGAGLLLALLVPAAGCASLAPERTEEVLEEDGGMALGARRIGLDVLTIPEGQRVMLVKSPEDQERVCSPRESDEGVSVSEGVQLSVPGAGGGVGIGETMGDQAVSLGSPSAVVQLARELLFRACELSLNLNADPAETRDIYERFLTALETIAPSLPPTPPADNDDDDGDGDG
jgi:hypothetical protein